tara:strand:+ start:114 stop:530 length:417 start_codon:yes stop_codon:yes gene_type:complete
MSAATNALEISLLDHLVGNATYTPGTLYLALATAVADPEAGTFTEVTNTGTAYTRQSLAASNWAGAASGSVTTDTNVSFTTATADYGTVTHIVVVGGSGADTQGGGVPLITQALTSSKTVETGDTFVVNAGNLTVNLT